MAAASLTPTEAMASIGAAVRRLGRGTAAWAAEATSAASGQLAGSSGVSLMQGIPRRSPPKRNSMRHGNAASLALPGENLSGGYRARTGDLQTASLSLSQLS